MESWNVSKKSDENDEGLTKLIFKDSLKGTLIIESQEKSLKVIGNKTNLQ